MTSPTTVVITDDDELESDHSQTQEMVTDDPPALDLTLGWEHALQSINDTVTKLRHTVVHQQAEITHLNRNTNAYENMTDLDALRVDSEELHTQLGDLFDLMQDHGSAKLCHTLWGDRIIAKRRF